MMDGCRVADDSDKEALVNVPMILSREDLDKEALMDISRILSQGGP